MSNLRKTFNLLTFLILICPKQYQVPENVRSRIYILIIFFPLKKERRKTGINTEIRRTEARETGVPRLQGGPIIGQLKPPQHHSTMVSRGLRVPSRWPPHAYPKGGQLLEIHLNLLEFRAEKISWK